VRHTAILHLQVIANMEMVGIADLWTPVIPAIKHPDTSKKGLYAHSFVKNFRVEHLRDSTPSWAGLECWDHNNKIGMDQA
jgi:hypothetical protein